MGIGYTCSDADEERHQFVLKALEGGALGVLDIWRLAGGKYGYEEIEDSLNLLESEGTIEFDRQHGQAKVQ